MARPKHIDRFGIVDASCPEEEALVAAQRELATLHAAKASGTEGSDAEIAEVRRRIDTETHKLAEWLSRPTALDRTLQAAFNLLDVSRKMLEEDGRRIVVDGFKTRGRKRRRR